MKPFGLILLVLVVLVLVLAVQVVRPHRHAPPDCTNQVLILKGPHGEVRECVCQAGALSTCFQPGP